MCNQDIIPRLCHRSSYLHGSNKSSCGHEMAHSTVHAVMKWPTLQSVKDIQRFIGFSNFWRYFIQGFSVIAPPLTILLKTKTTKLAWNEAAEAAFNTLKHAFTIALTLHHPDPERPFNIEVDTFETVVGAVLSQQFADPPKLFPIASFP